jgi:hypothetical protein
MNAFSRKRIVRGSIGIAAAGALALSLAACSTDSGESTDTASSSSSASSEPSAASTPAATIADLSNGVDTKVAVDQSFVDAITGLGLTPGVVGTATFTDGTFAFPITGGNVDYYGPDSDVRPYVQGEIDHDGSGLSLTAGDTVVELTDFRIDPGESKLYGTVTANGAVAAEDAYLFNLWGGTLEPIQMEGTNAVLTGTTVHISPDAAALLNETFGTDQVQDEMLVGTATITAATE